MSQNDQTHQVLECRKGEEIEESLRSPRQFLHLKELVEEKELLPIDLLHFSLESFQKKTPGLIEGVVLVVPDQYFHAVFGTEVVVLWVEVLVAENHGAPDELSFEEIWMIADLSELHHQIHQVLDLFLVLLQVEEIFKRNFALDSIVELSLSLRQIAVYLMFYFLPEFFFDVLLHPSQHEGLQNGVESVQLSLLELPLVLSVLYIPGKPLLELVVGVEELRHDEVEQGPEFRHCVLNRGSCQEELVSASEAQQCVPSLGLYVFDGLGFVQNDVLPLDSLESLLVRHCQLVAGYEYVERGTLLPNVFLLEVFLNYFAILLVTPVGQHLKNRAKPLDFGVPIVEGDCGSNDQEGAVIVLFFGQVTHQGQGLNRLPQTHFICKNTVDSLGV